MASIKVKKFCLRYSWCGTSLFSIVQKVMAPICLSKAPISIWLSGVLMLSSFISKILLILFLILAASNDYFWDTRLITLRMLSCNLSISNFIISSRSILVRPLLLLGSLVGVSRLNSVLEIEWLDLLGEKLSGSKRGLLFRAVCKTYWNPFLSRLLLTIIRLLGNIFHFGCSIDNWLAARVSSLSLRSWDCSTLRRKS